MFYILLLVMLITGGKDDGGDMVSSVEIYDPSNPSFSCKLQNMPDANSGHAAVGRTVCGGWGDLRTCVTLDNGQWQESHRLQQRRDGHVMWQSPSQGIIVMGGWTSGTQNTTERLEGNGNGWDLQHDTQYGDITNYQFLMVNVIIFSKLCMQH